MIRFRCPGCNSILRVADDKAGRKGKCPKCGSPILVPQPSEGPPTNAGQAPSSDKAAELPVALEVASLASRQGGKSTKPISKWFFLVSFLAGLTIGIPLMWFGYHLLEDKLEGSGIFFVGAGIALFAYGAGVWLIFIERIWEALQGANARTTPGKALGFLFIPGFNIYWIFQAYWGWAKDYNAYAKTRNLKLPEVPEGIALARCILNLAVLIPFVSVVALPAMLVCDAIFIAKACNGVNALARAFDRTSETAGE